jgi:uncharacterized protein (TIGR02466 family)
MTDQVQEHVFFGSGVYIVDKPEFLPAVNVTVGEYLKEARENQKNTDQLYPLQTAGFAHEPVLKDFTTFIAQAAWDILNNQGYAMEELGTSFREMWCQEHQKHQGHDEHVHSHGDQISGVYFTDCPENGCTLAIHDPRPGKNQINLPERDLSKITLASRTALFVPVPGRMYFINSWLPHSITRNMSDLPTRLVHFNLGIVPVTNKQPIVV